MTNDLTHASFFSGVGGLDLGLERAGWRTVSFSEIDPYASAVLAERWPSVPNLGDIVALSSGGDREHRSQDERWSRSRERLGRLGDDVHAGSVGEAWRGATLWSGGFPCQDLSVAGKRRGMGLGHGGAATEDTRSGLAFAFLDLVERYGPRFILLENVPGLLSSHGGRDMAALLGQMVELGYGVGYRMLDARYFGVPQRRRRVFILGDRLGGRAGAERAAEVLSVGSQCGRHPASGGKAGKVIARRTGGGPDGHRLWNATAAFGAGESDTVAGTLSRRDYKSPNHLVGEEAHPGRVRASDGMAGGAHDRGELAVAATLNSGGNNGGFRTEPGEHLVVQVTSGPKMIDASGYHRERLATDVTPILSDYEQPMLLGGLREGEDDPLLPVGLDSHRYRVAGNGVVSSVAYFIGQRLAEIVHDAE